MNWFNNLSNKSNTRFIKFDIFSFHPNISAVILDSFFNFAAGKTEITEDEKELMMLPLKPICLLQTSEM